MEFLGTRGKWSLLEKGVNIVDENNRTIVGSHGIAYSNYEPEYSVYYANSLLMSKAPELLENAQMRVDYLDLTNLEFYEKYGFNKAELIDRTRVLIKESTELK